MKPQFSQSPEAKALFSKIHWHIVPLPLIAYMIAYLDRINIGYAQLQMKQTLPFDEAVLWSRRRNLFYWILSV